MTTILMAASEAVPLAKTGGLADVCGTLPIALQQAGTRVTLIMPAYRSALRILGNACQVRIPFEVPIGPKLVSGNFLPTVLPGTSVPLILVENPAYFDRAELYTEGGVDYRDNCERFVFFSRAVMDAIRVLHLEPDVIHCNDWQTALIPVYLESEYRAVPGYEKISSLLTVHNLAYQGRFWHWDMLLTGLDWKLFNWRQLEFYGDLNLLKGGIVFANYISTVSPRYAHEIMTEQFGCGLDGVLRTRRAQLTGILNGVDYALWNPATDATLASRYSVSDWPQGKRDCKRALQQQLGLALEPEIPLVGFIGRLIEQKGIDLIARQIENWAPTRKVQWVVLGTGTAEYENRLLALSRQFPAVVAVRIEFSETLSRQILAGSNIFIMPSRFEPCGLTQFFSLKYGCVPLVHATGGLFDSITDVSSLHGQGNGFVFDNFSDTACQQTLARALRTYGTNSWTQLVETGMRQDWSWQRSAEQYQQLYQHAVAQMNLTACV